MWRKLSKFDKNLWIPSTKNMKKTKLKYIIIKLLKTNDEEKIFYKSRVKTEYRVTNIRIKPYISLETIWKGSCTTCLNLEKRRYKGDINTDSIHITKKIRQHYEKTFSNKLGQLKKMDKSKH